MSSIKEKRENNKTSKKGKTVSSWIIAIIITLSIVLYFSFGSWLLSLVTDQNLCSNKIPGCMLPSDPLGPPYSNINSNAGLIKLLETAKSAAKNWTILEFFKTLLGIVPDKNNPEKPAKRNFRRYSNKKVSNFLTKINVEGFKPFDLFNTPAGWPYSWAHEDSTEFTFNFSKWFGNMQITSWSTMRGVFFGYLSLFESFTENYYTRFILTWLMPIIVGIMVFFQPLISFLSCLWGNFNGAHSILWGIIFTIFPIITSVTMGIQNASLAFYVLLAGFLGSGARQFTKNMSLDLKIGYGRIIQAISILGFMTSLVLFVLDQN